MTHQHLTPEVEDYLEYLYMRDQEGYTGEMPPLSDRGIGELLRHHLAVFDAGTATLTKEGLGKAERAVRRHRLAERLLSDVMAVRGDSVDHAACEFEHSLHHGVDEHICTLLGHPTTCPHGRPIPPGKCCKEKKRAADSAIVQLSGMKKGERGTIAYLSSRQPETVQKLMALGALPGAAVDVIQLFPSVVFQVGQTQIAVDGGLAGDIYVRRSEG
jgi:DtxR family Mn-dependent transcriptional regulator